MLCQKQRSIYHQQEPQFQSYHIGNKYHRKKGCQENERGYTFLGFDLPGNGWVDYLMVHFCRSLPLLLQFEPLRCPTRADISLNPYEFGTQQTNKSGIQNDFSLKSKTQFSFPMTNSRQLTLLKTLPPLLPNFVQTKSNALHSMQHLTLTNEFLNPIYINL